jgi:hypothetical protein
LIFKRWGIGLNSTYSTGFNIHRWGAEIIKRNIKSSKVLEILLGTTSQWFLNLVAATFISGTNRFF